MVYKKILICGAGQLGSRYLQGLKNCTIGLEIFVYDVSKESLNRAEQRWIEFGGLVSIHKVFYIINPNEFPRIIDLTILSTTAESRPFVIREILKHCEVKYWILEKVLAQSIDALNEIGELVGEKKNAWVNTPRRIVPWHKKIKEQLESPGALHLVVTGGPWGLACNTIHFLDLLSWFSGEKLIRIDTSFLEKVWYKAKRPGNWEIFGTLKATFSNGSTAEITSHQNVNETYQYEISNELNSWKIDEEMGTAISNTGQELPGRLPFQSEMTAELVENILNNGSCDLPNLFESIELHKVFIFEMLEHWKFTSDKLARSVPIT